MKKLLFILSVVSLSACYHSATTPQSTSQDSGQIEQSQVPPTEANPTLLDAEGQSQAVDYTLDLANFTLTPNAMVAKPGQTLVVLLTNKQGFHDFVIDELNISSAKLQEGSQEVIQISIPEDAVPGTTYEYYCSVGNHKAQGMIGTLTIE